MTAADERVDKLEQGLEDIDKNLKSGNWTVRYAKNFLLKNFAYVSDNRSVQLFSQRHSQPQSQPQLQQQQHQSAQPSPAPRANSPSPPCPFPPPEESFPSPQRASEVARWQFSVDVLSGLLLGGGRRGGGRGERYWVEVSCEDRKSTTTPKVMMEKPYPRVDWNQTLLLMPRDLRGDILVDVRHTTPKDTPNPFNQPLFQPHTKKHAPSPLPPSIGYARAIIPIANLLSCDSEHFFAQVHHAEGLQPPLSPDQDTTEKPKKERRFSQPQSFLEDLKREFQAFDRPKEAEKMRGAVLGQQGRERGRVVDVSVSGVEEAARDRAAYRGERKVADFWVHLYPYEEGDRENKYHRAVRGHPEWGMKGPGVTLGFLHLRIAFTSPYPSFTRCVHLNTQPPYQEWIVPDRVEPQLMESYVKRVEQLTQHHPRWTKKFLHLLSNDPAAYRTPAQSLLVAAFWSFLAFAVVRAPMWQIPACVSCCLVCISLFYAWWPDDRQLHPKRSAAAAGTARHRAKSTPQHKGDGAKKRAAAAATGAADGGVPSPLLSFMRPLFSQPGAIDQPSLPASTTSSPDQAPLLPPLKAEDQPQPQPQPQAQPRTRKPPASMPTPVFPGQPPKPLRSLMRSFASIGRTRRNPFKLSTLARQTGARTLPIKQTEEASEASTRPMASAMSPPVAAKADMPDQEQLDPSSLLVLLSSQWQSLPLRRAMSDVGGSTTGAEEAPTPDTMRRNCSDSDLVIRPRLLEAAMREEPVDERAGRLAKRALDRHFDDLAGNHSEGLVERKVATVRSPRSTTVGAAITPKAGGGGGGGGILKRSLPRQLSQQDAPDFSRSRKALSSLWDALQSKGPFAFPQWPADASFLSPLVPSQPASPAKAPPMHDQQPKAAAHHPSATTHGDHSNWGSAAEAPQRQPNGVGSGDETATPTSSGAHPSVLSQAKREQGWGVDTPFGAFDLVAIDQDGHPFPVFGNALPEGSVLESFHNTQKLMGGVQKLAGGIACLGEKIRVAFGWQDEDISRLGLLIILCGGGLVSIGLFLLSMLPQLIVRTAVFGWVLVKAIKSDPTLRAEGKTTQSLSASSSPQPSHGHPRSLSSPPRDALSAAHSHHPHIPPPPQPHPTFMDISGDRDAPASPSHTPTPTITTTQDHPDREQQRQRQQQQRQQQQQGPLQHLLSQWENNLLVSKLKSGKGKIGLFSEPTAAAAGGGGGGRSGTRRNTQEEEAPLPQPQPQPPASEAADTTKLPWIPKAAAIKAEDDNHQHSPPVANRKAEEPAAAATKPQQQPKRRHPHPAPPYRNTPLARSGSLREAGPPPPPLPRVQASARDSRGLRAWLRWRPVVSMWSVAVEWVSGWVDWLGRFVTHWWVRVPDQRELDHRLIAATQCVRDLSAFLPPSFTPAHPNASDAVGHYLIQCASSSDADSIFQPFQFPFLTHRESNLRERERFYGSSTDGDSPMSSLFPRQPIPVPPPPGSATHHQQQHHHHLARGQTDLTYIPEEDRDEAARQDQTLMRQRRGVRVATGVGGGPSSAAVHHQQGLRGGQEGLRRHVSVGGAAEGKGEQTGGMGDGRAD
ncbi:unnamed protein product [Vitrella brassicaformis CCMP3155]|uniref:Uncharacterized protein n=3 Tax=Vitrella brassicaformis TaxID=1169539 RepID=A0A0G4FJP0_VITBC|nr:unnamed protein product [Vitrella brassicaformis CCMP3155]|eukprot:CEM13908.1 unnamed protein product [Vitrella brassicaformis CCMP3155]